MRLTNAQITDLARRIITNQTYLAMTEQELDLSFGFTLSMAAIDLKRSEIETWGAVYEDYSQALPRTVNGRPMFFSCRILHVNDVPRLFDEISRMEEALA